jgi:signal transduction histidine kinase
LQWLDLCQAWGKANRFRIPLYVKCMSNVWTLLITDDCQEDREVYREYLSGDPDQVYQFIEAGSAEMGLALCQKQHCDAILLDFRLPDMTGLEFLDHLKQQSDSSLPVIMLTGQGDERIAVQAIKRGAQDYLVKQDLEPDVLQDTVRKAIYQSRLQHQFNPSGQLAQALEALETEKQLNVLKSQLVTTVSHEYRTPLAAILAAASTLKLHSDQLPETKQQQFLQMIETKARQMAQLVEDLLVLETFESGKINFLPLPFELLQFISELIEEQRQAASQHHDLSFKITGNTKGFLGDQKLLRLILINLLSNAIKYSVEGGAIEVHLIGTETQIELQIRDQGIGIPIAEQAQVFQSFNRGSNVGNVPGTGLGLAVVKACVDLHGGKIRLKSQPGQGTEFTVYLPKRSVTDLRLSHSLDES